ncbi:hypothetical protein BT93_L1662 [Corymbia citriodora subsp. variegata]|uniref:Glutaredoxin domain-containing protein n=1 Tax=Corymbia citriodora subsp. variegata TaxID=360336 RepID=A0A8T0CZ66_CORYI|nr:hypothetical protein BT93_L1662 [Corymbia citriodora subsp. variegata]
MTGMKGRFLKKLKFISTISTLRRGLASQLSHAGKPSDENGGYPPPVHNEGHQGGEVDKPVVQNSITDLRDGQEEDGQEEVLSSLGSAATTPATDDLEEEIFSDAEGDAEFPFSALDVPTDYEICSRPADSSPGIAKDQLRIEDSGDYKEHVHLSLSDFQEKCPPGGRESVIFYTTSLTGIRRTFEDCNAVRFLLKSFKINFHERDVSLHLQYLEELRNILGQGVIPPKLFIRGRYIGGADKVITLHEQGSLRKLFEGIPLDLSKSTCVQCANVRFVICLACHGSCRVVKDKEEESWIRCPECNENGLIKCPACC